MRPADHFIPLFHKVLQAWGKYLSKVLAEVFSTEEELFCLMPDLAQSRILAGCADSRKGVVLSERMN